MNVHELKSLDKIMTYSSLYINTCSKINPKLPWLCPTEDEILPLRIVCPLISFYSWNCLFHRRRKNHSKNTYANWIFPQSLPPREHLSRTMILCTVMVGDESVFVVLCFPPQFNESLIYLSAISGLSESKTLSFCSPLLIVARFYFKRWVSGLFLAMPWNN